ncbi:MAG: glycosyltransferase family 4 protein [Candidatus Methanoplasma sp.]|jgi:glycosyltransferase involved in cell wall biosynthesis|nr:glycosyltransferase family 4 protein [Candidatus Methanoplasma sp.]
MDIIDVNPFFYPFRGGIEHRLHETSRLLSERGHKVTILTGRLPGTSEEEEMDGYRVIRLKSRLINVYNPPFISSKDVLETLESIDPDIVNYNYRWAPSYNRDLAKYDGKKVFTYHNMWGEGIGIQARLSEFNDGRFRKCLETFDHIITVSEFVRDDLLRRGFAPHQITSIPTGLSSFPEEGKGDGDFILSLGRLVRTKGLDYMIEAMQDIDYKLIICGKGPDAKRIEKKISKFGLEDKIEVKGWVSEEEKEYLMGACKFFVMPSLFESLGLAAIELMSHGRPLVYSSVNGLPETVRDGGISVPPKDPAAITAAANALLYDEEYREELGRNAAARARGYNWADLIPKIEDVFGKVLSGEYSRQK